MFFREDFVKRTATVLVTAFLYFGAVAGAQDCKALGSDAKAGLVTYVAKKHDLGADSNLVLKQEEFVPGTCYRRLSFWSGAQARAVVLYLSPDLRFLSPSLMDSSINPTEDAKQEAAMASKLLASDESPSHGPKDAPVTLVEFSDFQCPHCQQLAGLLKTLPAEKAAEVRTVYKHMPLPSHDWAREASLTAICAGFQSKLAFWQFHDFFFSEQTNLTAANIHERSLDLAAKIGLNSDVLKSCLNSSTAEETLSKDVITAQKLQVNGTPAIFVNGIRVHGVRTTDDLIAGVDAAIHGKPTKSTEQP
jgi:protein-disulfide isomerase